MITQTNFCMNNLEAPLIGIPSKDTEIFQDVGIDALVRSIKSAPLDKDIIHNCSISLLNKKLNLLAGTTKCNQEFYEYDLKMVMNNILKSVEKFHDIVYVDTNSGKRGLTLQVLDESDLIVVNLSQNKRMFDAYFEEYMFDARKTFYLIGNYDKNSKNNINNIRRRYKQINLFNSAVIPYNTEFSDAQSEGKLIDFMKRNINSNKDDVNRNFMAKVSEASNKILMKAGWKGGFNDIYN